MLLQVKRLIQIIVKFRAEKVCARFYYAPNILLRGTKYRAQTRSCSNTLEGNEFEVYISLNGNKLVRFGNSKSSFQNTIWFMISEKSISRYMFLHRDWWTCTRKVSSRHIKNCLPEFTIILVLKLSSYGLVVFVDMNTYILKEGRNLKTFLTENYAIALENYYLQWNLPKADIL